MKYLGLPALCAVCTASSVSAQLLPSLPRVYAGVEVGEGTRGPDRGALPTVIEERSDHGIDYGLFAGVEVPSAPLLFYGLEAGIGQSEARPRTITFQGTQVPQSVLVGAIETIRVDPRWNHALTARLGLSPLPGLGLYGLAGYAAEKVRIDRSDDLGVPGSISTGTIRERDTRDGITYGAGVRYRFGLIGARVEYRRRETAGRYDPDQVMGGVLVAV